MCISVNPRSSPKKIICEGPNVLYILRISLIAIFSTVSDVFGAGLTETTPDCSIDVVSDNSLNICNKDFLSVSINGFPDYNLSFR